LHIDQRVVGFRIRVALHGSAAGHVAMVHPGHVAVIHRRHAPVIHAHIAHGNEGPRVYRRNRGLQTLADSQGASGVSRAIHRLREDRVSLRVFGLDNDVVGFRDGYPELID